MAPSLRPVHRPSRQSAHPVRSNRTQVTTYRESDDEDGGDGLDEYDDYEPVEETEQNGREPVTRRPELPAACGLPEEAEIQGASNAKPENPTSVVSSKTRSSTSHPKRTSPSKPKPKPIKTISPIKRRKVDDSADAVREIDPGMIPPWQALPYHILLDIMTRASTICYEDNVQQVTGSVRWLLRVAYLCKTFYEPAIATLYYSPPVHTSSRLTGLTRLLANPQSSLFINYRNKVKKLEIDLRHLPLQHLDVCQLIAYTPQLRDILIHYGWEYSTPPFVSGGTGLAWLSWEKLFNALDTSNVHLHSWEWNGDLFGISEPSSFSNLTPVHVRPAFQSLRSVQFLNVMPPRKLKNKWDEYREGLEDDVIASLSTLSHLTRLQFRNCCFVNDSFLLRLPTTLGSLSLIDCDDVTSEVLSRFLEGHGRGLHTLVLGQNRYLNMSFTTELAQLCPQLEVFKMDFNFTSPSHHTHDVEPYFDELLCDTEVPKWPTTLQWLELERLQKWDIDTATVLCKSLVDSAHQLPNLRRLIMTATLNVGWRDRARFRKEWAHTFKKVFLRKSQPPNPNHKYVRQSVTDSKSAEPGTLVSTENSPPISKRQSARVAEQKLQDTGEHWRSDEDSPQLHKNGEQGAGSNAKAVSIHGLCDIVEFRIDNLRPADHLLTADDFQDKEVSGDEDWSGRDPDIDESTYAW